MLTWINASRASFVLCQIRTLSEYAKILANGRGITRTESDRRTWGAQMPVGICMITAGLAEPSAIGCLLQQCGFEVWTPDSPDACNGHIYNKAVCLVIDMPLDAGFHTLRLFRDYGINTPALLIVDPGLEVACADRRDGRLGVVPRTADPRKGLHWIASVCAAKQYGRENGAAERVLMRA
jgi:hypothetical protein